ncbi:hypothetical protein ACNO8S_03920 [Haloarcula sp. KBTZ06]|uniref:DUF2064 domain-containing protein n=1 Tax=Haloarcula hispanica TaxID=51589 RepID=A0A482SYN2_HALHI|nr:MULTISPECIES: hypothetical protein [Haloarcula]KAA9409213.1 hypothetical protein EGO51_05205 [Haloarcula hispanica]KZX48158.1 hypothetical protein AV929_10690 [Haloarcula sp. K1]MCJ0618262.1 hypothetical protein [Haloarcula hispanica]MUV49790.1 hypothetical protein [Haloarcula sp. CBA1122]RYJ08868.1 hypothetical protein ELS20_01640 [Haloarcula hispanica]
MTTVTVLADPPVEGFVLQDLAGDLLDDAEAAKLYEAMLLDVCRAVEISGAELLVNYRASEQVPDGVDPETAVREPVTEALESPGNARFEVQVGSTFAGRVGNTVTHLLNREDVATVAAVEPTAALLNRQLIDSAAMKLRSSGVVLGPAEGGRVYYAGFGEPIDFEDSYATPAVETIGERAADAGLDVDFLPSTPVLETQSDLKTMVPLLRARNRAGRVVPERTMTFFDDLGIRVVDNDGEPTVVRETDRS